MEFETPSTGEWQRLYQAAIALKEEEPWEWLYEDEIFGVENPETGQIGYVSIMGSAGEHLALAIYLGSEGLDGFWRMQQGEAMANPAIVYEIPQLQASFEDRNILDASDRATIKELGLKFRGRQAWPMFRSYQPGCAPWFLTAAEARFLALTIEQALDVARRVCDDTDLLEPEAEDEYLVRVQTEEGWADEWLVPSPPALRPTPAIDAGRLAALEGAFARQTFALEVDLFAMPSYVKEKDDTRPYVAYNLMLVEASSGMIVGTEVMIAKPDFSAMEAQAQAGFLDTLERLRATPGLVAVRDERLYHLLAPAASALGFQLLVSPRLPALDEARDALERTFL
ncbi:MAG: hypothetical protein PVF47_00800 [Anaerolineae bacterium]|jgi:hypothetical protein